MGQKFPAKSATRKQKDLTTEKARIAVALPYNTELSEDVIIRLKNNNIPVLLEHEIPETDPDFLGGILVLVPEPKLEQTDGSIRWVELNAFDDDEEDEFEDFDDDLDFEEEEEEFDEDEDWDDDLDFEDDEFEDEDFEEEYDEDFDEDEEEDL